MRKKIFTFLLALVTSVGMMNAKVTWNSSNMSSFSISDTDQPYTLEGVTLRTNASLAMAYCDGNGDEIHFVSYDPDGFTFSNTLGKNFTKIEMFLTSSGEWGNANLGSGWSFMNNGPVTWTGNASTVDLLKGEDDFGGASVKIVFYFEGDSQEPDPTPAQPSWVSDGDTWDESTKTLTVNSNPGVVAYEEKTEIQHLVISNSVTSIGDRAFSLCTGITSIDIPSSVTSIGNSAFSVCINATSLTIPNSVVSIGVGAFSSCNKLTSVTIPNSVTSIETSTFRECSDLTSVTIPNSVTSIGDEAFRNCTGITSIEIPNSVISIGKMAFQYCGLTSVTIPNSVTSIGEEAFQNCSGMTSVTIPNSITSIEKGGFQYCGLTSVTIPSSVTTIGVSAFAGCEALTSVTIPNGVTTIKESAFQHCIGLTSVTISSSVTSIEVAAFLWCGNIADVYCYPNAASLTWVGDPSDFKENKATYCHVPVSQWAAYEAKFSDVNVTFIGDLPDPTPDPDEVAADAVEDLINAIPNPVAYNDECKNAIDAAREAYDALTDAQKALVGNYSTLTDAEAAYDALIPTPVDPDPAGPTIPCTAADLGKVLCTDGSIYATVSEASAASKTAAAVIAYVDTENNKGLALALANESDAMDWETAKTTAAAHTPAVSGGTWTLASKDDWDHMINAAGGYNALRDGFSGVGGTNIQKGQYWTSTEYDSGLSMVLNFGTNDGGYFVALYEDAYNVRACLAFDISAAPQPAAVIHDSDDAATIETFLSTNNGTEIAELTIDRPVLNNMYNTLCLPFDMDAAQIAASSLNGVEIYELEEVTVANDELFLGLSDAVNAVVAGRPYIVKYSAASQLSDLDFENVTINNADLDDEAITMNGVTFKGTFTPFVMGIQNGFDTNGGYLFLGQNNVLYWPNTDNPLKPFRAYFYIDLNSGSSNAPLRFGMPARIGRPAQMPTGVENVQSDKVQSTKVIENGQLYIIKNGVKYNAQGQIVK